MKKILFVSKFFSGFETSIINKEFKPTGAPTAYKLIEKLDIKYNLKLILTSKNDLEDNSLNFFKKLRILGLKNDILILGSFNFKIFKKFNNLLRELIHLIFILYQLLIWKPNIIYCGNANIISAAFIARFFKTKVIFRVMGVYETMRSYHYNKSFRNKFYLWCYASKFDLIICTQDGSGIEDWIQRTVNKKTKCYKLINGVNFINNKININSKDNKISILFIGRLEKEKGILELMEVINYLYINKRKYFKFMIVGTGVLENKLINFINKLNSDFITYQKKIPHNEIHNIYLKNDVFISLNKRGSLSNTMLEAMSNNLCCICLNSNNSNGIDVFTDQFLDKNYFLRVNRNNIVDNLNNILTKLDKSKILKIKQHTNIFVNQNIKLWDKRIEEELKIISELI